MPVASGDEILRCALDDKKNEAALIDRNTRLLGDPAHLVAENPAQAAHRQQILGLGGALDRFGDLAQ
jgi:hypothetical protein